MPDDERFLRLQALFDAALDLPADGRAEFVRAQAADDSELAAEALSMLSNASDHPTANFVLQQTLPTPIGLTQPPLPRLFGNYLLLREIAAGGMGVVYEAEDQASGERLALKQIRADIATPEARSRFEREARLGATIDSPHCVFVRTAGVINAVPYLTMELLPGETLESVVTSRGALPPAEVLGHAMNICAGVRALHDADVLHRDLKPSNCLLTADGLVKVGDLGVSRSLASQHAGLTRTGQLLGTPVFAAPEQLRGDPVDERADVYGICATLHYLLSGRAPFGGDSYEHVIARVMTATPPPLDGVPVGMATVVQRGMAKAPTARPSSVRELEYLLTTALPSHRTRATAIERTAAAVVDFGVLFGLLLLAHLAAYPWLDLFELRWQTVLAGDPTWLIVLLLATSYFAIAESHYGASLGKRLVSLEVVDRHAGGRISMARAAVRSLTFVMAFSSYEFLTMPAVQVLMPLLADLGLAWASALALPVCTATCYVAPFLLLFLPAHRRKNALGLHDLLANSDVVRRRPMPAALRRARELGLDHVRGQSVEYDAYLGRHVLVVPRDSLRGDASDPNVVANVVRGGQSFALATIPHGDSWQTWLDRTDVSWSESRRVLLQLCELQDLYPFDPAQLVIGQSGIVRCLPRLDGSPDPAPGQIELRDLTTRVTEARRFSMPLRTREALERSQDTATQRQALTNDDGADGRVTKNRRFATVAASATLFFAAVLVQYSLQTTQRVSHRDQLTTTAEILTLLSRPIEDAEQRKQWLAAYAEWQQLGDGRPADPEVAMLGFQEKAATIDARVATRTLDWQRGLLWQGAADAEQWIIWSWDFASEKQKPQWLRLLKRTSASDPWQRPFLDDVPRRRTLSFPLLAGLAACLLAFATRGQLPARFGGLAIMDRHGLKMTRLRAAFRTSLPFLAAWLAVVVGEWADWAFERGGLIAAACYMSVALVTIGYPLLAFRDPARMPHDVIAGTRAVVR